MRQLSENELAPNVVFCNHYSDGMTLPIHYELDQRYIYDYEIELITDCDDGYMIQNGKIVYPQKGDLFFRRPGETTKGVMRYSSYIFCFEHKKSMRKFPGGYDLMKTKSFQAPVSHIMLDDLPNQFHTSYYNRYLNQFMDLYNNFISPHPGSLLFMAALAIQILYQLNQELNEVIDHSHKKTKDIKKVIRYIESHLTEELSLDFLSSLVHLTPTYFHQLFTKIVGVTLQRFIITKRITTAKELLVHTTLSIKEITNQSGFNDSSYFCYAFKREQGVTPLSYREAHQLSFIDDYSVKST
jgi:AraC-like DNA-binding protein